MTVASVVAVQQRIAALHMRFADAAAFRVVLDDAGRRVAAVDDQHRLVGAAPAERSPASQWSATLPAQARRWVPHIERAARRHNLDPRLLAALVKHESGFDPDARSHAGARGLTQLMPATARGLGVDADDPLENLDGGARYLREQLDRFGTVRLALAAYNAGPGRVAEAGGVPRIGETQNYVRAVLGSYAAMGGTNG